MITNKGINTLIEKDEKDNITTKLLSFHQSHQRAVLETANIDEIQANTVRASSVILHEMIAVL